MHQMKGKGRPSYLGPGFAAQVLLPHVFLLKNNYVSVFSHGFIPICGALRSANKEIAITTVVCLPQGNEPHRSDITSIIIRF